MSKYLNRYTVESSRLKGHDYSANAKYFVTINTYRNQNYFGRIVQTRLGASPQLNAKINEGDNISVSENAIQHLGETHQGASLRLTELGLIAHRDWAKLPEHFPFITLDEFVIMPNHIHGIICFNGIKKNHIEPNKFGSKKGSLGTVINLFKGGIKRYANKTNIEFRWHPRYYDRIIQNEVELNNVRAYIKNNPSNWKQL